MDFEIDSLYNDIIEFCKAASESLGQLTSKSPTLTTPIQLPKQTQASQPSESPLSEDGESGSTPEQEPTSEFDDDISKDIYGATTGPGWTEREDQILLEVITNYKKNWDKIKVRIFKLTKMRKTVGFLRKRYAEIVSSTKEKKNTKYTHAEDLRIAHGILIHGFDWIKIAGDLPDRDSRSIKNRYYYHISKKNLMDSLTDELSKLEWSQFKEIE